MRTSVHADGSKAGCTAPVAGPDPAFNTRLPLAQSMAVLIRWALVALDAWAAPAVVRRKSDSLLATTRCSVRPCKLQPTREHHHAPRRPPEKSRQRIPAITACVAIRNGRLKENSRLSAIVISPVRQSRDCRPHPRGKKVAGAQVVFVRLSQIDAARENAENRYARRAYPTANSLLLPANRRRSRAGDGLRHETVSFHMLIRNAHSR